MDTAARHPPAGEWSRLSRVRQADDVYATCLFCHAALGRNEAVEHFPVGRRLAYDARKGRLWVVCRRCERWNLTPLEERWEAIEELERLFRAARLRISTDNIGLARSREGLELVRIGAPPRVELACWRYAARLGRRRRRYLAAAAAGTGAGAASFAWVAGGPAAMLLSAVTILFGVAIFSRELVSRGPIVPDGSGGHRDLDWPELRLASLERVPEVGDWALRLPRASVLPALRDMRESFEDFEDELEVIWRERLGSRPLPQEAAKAPRLVAGGTGERIATLRGDEAHRALASILPFLNGASGSTRHVREAVDVVADAAGVHQLLYSAAAARSRARTPNYVRRLPPPLRLALEMALHESEERRAMEGEFAMLEERWRQAEEIARIADALTLPAGVVSRLDRLRQRLDPQRAEKSPATTVPPEAGS